MALFVVLLGELLWCQGQDLLCGLLVGQAWKLGLALGCCVQNGWQVVWEQSLEAAQLQLDMQLP